MTLDDDLDYFILHPGGGMHPRGGDAPRGGGWGGWNAPRGGGWGSNAPGEWKFIFNKTLG